MAQPDGLVFVMDAQCVFFEVGSEVLNVIYVSFMLWKFIAICWWLRKSVVE